MLLTGEMRVRVVQAGKVVEYSGAGSRGKGVL
ncbi:hypothetical protein HRbin02_00659 [Candidatus Calditenuaceae archaeon HR02]|nr:hypothetical protein HRbin02_00659 [Candidatus Calditenuaceae archaeon HR02]